MVWIGPIIGCFALSLALWRWRQDSKRERRQRLERIASRLTGVLNAAGSALLLPSGHIEESRRVKACEYAVADLRIALSGLGESDLPKCREVAAVPKFVPRTIEGIYPLLVQARAEVEAALLTSLRLELSDVAQRGQDQL